jgi:hypothetical protein
MQPVVNHNPGSGPFRYQPLASVSCLCVNGKSISLLEHPQAAAGTMGVDCSLVRNHAVEPFTCHEAVLSWMHLCYLSVCSNNVYT